MVKLFSKNSNLCDYNHQRHERTDGRTDGQMTCDRNTALCTNVHRAVKMHFSHLFYVPIIRLHRLGHIDNNVIHNMY